MPVPQAGIYISIPFCAQKCTYCNFRSDVFGRSLRAQYVSWLAKELAAAGAVEGDTLYFGGGSPSLLEPEEFRAIAARLPAREWAEATIEVAPGEAPAERVDQWLAAGVNRASLGVQSFQARVARQAGRRHTAETVTADVRRLRSRGIRQISVDLIAGLAGQTETTWKHSLDWIERLDVDHVSVYMLETDDASRLGRELRAGGKRYGARHVPSEDMILDLYLLAVDRLRGAGYQRYEISNFARPGCQSLHNLKYWNMTPYWGFGGDAHSFDGLRRWWNVPTAPEYVGRFAAEGSPRGGIRQISPSDRRAERILTGLRTSRGVRLSEDEWRDLLPTIRGMAERGWLEDSPSRTLRLSDEGLLFADEAVALLAA